MWATDRHAGLRRPLRPLRPPRPAARGATAIEFALLALVFLAFVFGTLEVARLLYLYNTLQEVTRRAAVQAAVTYPRDTAGIERLKRDAVFRDSPGGLLLGAPVTDRHIRIEYLALTRAAQGNALSMELIPAASLPSCAAQNRLICMGNPNAANCIRLVRVSICDPAVTATCQAATSAMLMPLIDLGANAPLDLRVRLHKATTIATVESLGYQPGSPPCAEPAGTP